MYDKLSKTLTPEFIHWLITNHYEDVKEFYAGYLNDFYASQLGDLTFEAKRKLTKRMLEELVSK